MRFTRVLINHDLKMREVGAVDWNQFAILFLKPSSSPDGREKALFEGSLADSVARLTSQMSSSHVIWTASFVYSGATLQALLDLRDAINGVDIGKSANSHRFESASGKEDIAFRMRPSGQQPMDSD